jgi:hypothetical protein
VIGFPSAKDAGDSTSKMQKLVEVRVVPSESAWIHRSLWNMPLVLKACCNSTTVKFTVADAGESERAQ